MTAADARRLMPSEDHWVDVWYNKIVSFIEEAARSGKSHVEFSQCTNGAFNNSVLQRLKDRLKKDLFMVTVESEGNAIRNAYRFDISWGEAYLGDEQ